MTNFRRQWRVLVDKLRGKLQKQKKRKENNVTVRTKKKGNPTMGKTRNPKSYGIKKNHGQFVHQNEILVNQSSLRFYPGQNVDIDRSNRLIALTDGTVIISCETLNPYPDSPLYGPVQSGMVVKKKFFNIIPLTLKGKFRLVSEN